MQRRELVKILLDAGFYTSMAEITMCSSRGR